MLIDRIKANAVHSKYGISKYHSFTIICLDLITINIVLINNNEEITKPPNKLSSQKKIGIYNILG